MSSRRGAWAAAATLLWALVAHGCTGSIDTGSSADDGADMGDAGKTDMPAAACGDDLCGADEDCATCAADCGECPATPDTCGNSACDTDEDCGTCSTDCGLCPPPPPDCNDGTCDTDEDCNSCASDCGLCPPPPPPPCGNGTCAADETCSSCAADCGACPPPPPSCGDGTCAATENCGTCAGDCGACPPPPPVCGDKSCNGTETCGTCQADCGVCPPPPPNCGDKTCNGTETCGTCQGDCGVCPPPPAVCGDKTCAATETHASCAADCPFVHPGVGLSLAQLDFVKGKIASKAEPWTGALAKSQSSGTSSSGQRFSSLTYVPRPVPIVKCVATYGQTYIAAHPEMPELAEAGCLDQTDDAIAAYIHALLWYYTGNRAHALKSIEIMNAWSGKLTAIWFDQPRSDTNKIIYEQGKLQAAWTTEEMVRAAEIIRYTFKSTGSEAVFNVSNFSAMLRNVMYPLVESGWTGGVNWIYSMADATMGIGVFLDDQAIYNNGYEDFRRGMPAAIYLTTDDPSSKYPNLVGVPFPPPLYDKPAALKADVVKYWHSPTKFVNGQEGETCRDMSHMVMGLAAMGNAAETARIQGNDLYGEFQARLVAATELNASFINANADGQPAPATWPCPKAISLGGTGYKIGWEVLYNHYASRKGVAMPQTLALINRFRPMGTGLHLSWQTLSSAGVP